VWLVGWCLQDLPFDDGMPPPDSVVMDWFEVLRSRFTADPTSCVAVHCVAGLGRYAPPLTLPSIPSHGH